MSRLQNAARPTRQLAAHARRLLAERSLNEGALSGNVAPDMAIAIQRLDKLSEIRQAGQAPGKRVDLHDRFHESRADHLPVMTTGSGWILSVGREPASARPLPAKRLMARTVMS